MEVGLPRHVPNNPYKYSNTELAVRKTALRGMKRDYPGVPDMWLEMLYDTTNKMSSEELEKIINEGQWEYESKYKAIGGVSHDVEVVDP
jgi:hypothetical protein